jgi:hypothetical protein
LGLFLALAGTMCAARQGKVTTGDAPHRDINAVLRAHDRELMAIPGVSGVYIGLLDDTKTSCLRVIVARKTRELERKIPRRLEGYQVVIEENGPIRPMRKQN